MPTRMQRKLDVYEFLMDIIAHEIRNPLNSIIMFGNLLEEGAYGKLDSRQAEVIRRILASAYRIEHMAGDFLNMRRVDSGEELLRREWLELEADIVGATLRDLGAKFPVHASRLARVEREGCPGTTRVLADRQLLMTIYDNLFFNALKYGRKNGRIAWGCRTRPTCWELWVTNEGQGVRAADLPAVFRKFHRVRDEKLPQQPGTGLGLYNVQRIVRLHGGRVRAESRYGRDFTVRFTIRRPAGEGPAAGKGARRPRAGEGVA